MVLPVRGHLDAVKRLLKGDLYIGRGSRQRSLGKGRYCNNYKVSEFGRDVAITKFREMLLQDESMFRSLWTLSGRRLICHCRPTERCVTYPNAYDRTAHGENPPEPRVLSFMAKLREEPDSDDGSSPDEDAPGKSAGHRGRGEPMKVGVGYTQREFWDGQSLASPGRWPPGSHVYPSSDSWIAVADCFLRLTHHYGTEQLLISLAMGKVDACSVSIGRSCTAQAFRY